MAVNEFAGLFFGVLVVFVAALFGGFARSIQI
jgi:hypothetical protein